MLVFHFYKRRLAHGLSSLFGAVLVVCLLFVLVRMPETLGRMPSEILNDVRMTWGMNENWQQVGGFEEGDINL